jgi:hypothetical protein
MEQFSDLKIYLQVLKISNRIYALIIFPTSFAGQGFLNKKSPLG